MDVQEEGEFAEIGRKFAEFDGKFLGFTQKCFRVLLEVLACISALVSVFGGAYLGVHLFSESDMSHYGLIGAILGMLIGFISFCMTFGLLATFVSLAKDTKEINEKLKA